MAEILIVEDESIVARDIKNRLKDLGYTVSAVVSSGEEAIKRVAKESPDLVLMDIVLKGEIDGIEAAEIIRTQLATPVVYVTAHADEKTLQRAKVTEPFGYILKPFEDKELYTVIEMALYMYEMERRLKESEQWLSTTLKSIGEGVIATDTKESVTFMNPLAEQLTGWTQKEAAGKPLTQIFCIMNENTGVRIKNPVTEVVREGAVVRTTNNTALLDRNGTKIPIDSSISLIKDDKETIIGVAVVFQDITERKQGEEALRSSEAKFRSLFENALEGIYRTTPKGKILSANPALVHMLGYESEAELCNLSTANDLYADPKQRKDITKRLEKESNLRNVELVLKRKDGHKITVLENARAVKDERGRILYYEGTLTDITERKKAEEALRESRLQLKNLFDASRLINSTMDMEEIYKFISDSVRELVEFDNFIIFIVSEDRNSIHPVFCSGRTRDKMEDMVLEYGEGLVGHCIEARETLLTGNAHKDERAKKIPGVTETFTSQIIIPLIIEDECVGALHISRAEENAYEQKDVDVLKLLSEVVASAIRNSQLHNEIKEFSQDLEKRVKEKSRRTEIILNTRQALQTERSWKKGLITIVENMSDVGFERVGIFLVNPQRKTLDFYFGEGAELPEKGTSISLKNSEYSGVKCVLEKKTMHVKDFFLAEGKHTAFESESFVWVPIVVQNEAFAALAADNIKSSKIITDEDVKDLEILAGMCAAFIDRTRILIEPAAEKALRTEFKYWLDSMEGYIVPEEKPEKSFEIFVDLVTHGIPGFVITRMYPEKLKKRYKLVRTPMLWLSRTEGENTLNPDDLSKMSYIVENFTRKSEESVVLLDGLEYLVTQNNFSTILKYLQELKDAVVLNNARLIIPLHKGTLSPGEYSALEREFAILSG